jgi:hypothetical protein
MVIADHHAGVHDEQQVVRQTAGAAEVIGDCAVAVGAALRIEDQVGIDPDPIGAAVQALLVEEPHIGIALLGKGPRATEIVEPFRVNERTSGAGKVDGHSRRLDVLRAGLRTRSCAHQGDAECRGEPQVGHCDASRHAGLLSEPPLSGKAGASQMPLRNAYSPDEILTFARFAGINSPASPQG